MYIESENTEFKARLTDDLYREVIAFANTNGGTIYIGIDDQGNAMGVANVDDVYTRITNGIRDAIQPDVTLFTQYMLQEDHVIKITVGEGSYKPYYLKAKGLKPSGVFVRQGASSVQASFDQIRAMIKASDGDSFEAMRAMDQDLSFSGAKAAFEKHKIAFSEEKYRVLGITDASGSLYTNLAWLISDQCQHTIKIAVFADEANTQFRDSKEFSGSLFKQLDDAFDYLMLCNRTKATFEGLERIERPDYPTEALREALLNALVHRDYSYSGSIIINVNDCKMEFISIGGLVPGLSPEDIRSGISQPRNKNLAEIFHRLKLIESYGTGIRKIYRFYEGCGEQPGIEVTRNTFKMVLPNQNTVETKQAELPRGGHLSEQQEIVLRYIGEHGAITEAEIQTLFGVKRTRAYTIAKDMRAAGLIVVKGRGADKKYTAK